MVTLHRLGLIVFVQALGDARSESVVNSWRE